MSTTAQPDPLFSHELEEAVVGSVLINPAIFPEIGLTSKDFFIHRLGWIWESITRLNQNDDAVDYATISEDLDRSGRLKEIGGQAYLVQLIQRTPTSLHAKEYAASVKDYARRRVWEDQAKRIAKLAYDRAADLEVEAAGIVDELLNAIRNPGAAVHWSEFVNQVYLDAESMRADPREVWGMKTHFIDFDQITGGLHPGEMMSISGDPGIGKSMLVDQMGFQMAYGGEINHVIPPHGTPYGVPGVIYSLEMLGTSVARRLITGYSQVPTRSIKTGHVNDDQWASFVSAVETAGHIPLFMSDSAQWTTASLQADLSRLKVREGIQWFVLDYAYLMRDGDNLSENDKTGLISSRLKAMCRSLNLAGMIILSLNKEGDVRGNAQQKYDADLILTLHEEKSQPGIVTCVFKKGRELERPKQAFDLFKSSGFPAFKNAVRRTMNIIGGNGHERS